MISGATRVAGVMGDPVARSLSPLLHNAAYEALGLDWVYVAWPVPAGGGASAVAALAALGAAGANVTMPLKEEVAAAADRVSPVVARLGAANTLVVAGDEVTAHNTDVDGFLAALRDDLGFEPRGQRAVVIGSGGAARAAVAALDREDIGRVTVVGRRGRPTRAVAALAGDRGRPLPLAAAAVAAAVGKADLVVNATPLGMRGETLPAAVIDRLRAGQAVLDLVYAPPDTWLIGQARARGARAAGGLGMLVHQAGLAFELMTGQPAPLEAMSAAALSYLVKHPPAPAD